MVRYLYDNTVDIKKVRNLLYKRFRSAIYHDLVKASSPSEYIIAKNIAELHNGSLSATSIPKSKTTFTLILPLNSNQSKNDK